MQNNYIDDRKLTGGMNSSLGFKQQDLAAIKYIFDYCGKGLERISFESDDDFVLHFKNGRKMQFQSKINALNVNSVSELLSKYKGCDNDHVFIGSYIEDHFRNIMQKYDRFLNAKEFKESEKLKKDFEDACQKWGIDGDLLQKHAFHAIPPEYAKDLAIKAIDDYSRSRFLFVDSESVLMELAGKISIELRPVAGSLGKNDIDSLLIKYRRERVPSVYRSDPIISDTIKLKVVNDLDDMIQSREYKSFKDKLIIIKNYIEMNQYVHAKNVILDFIDEAKWIISIYLWVLNMLRDYGEISNAIEQYESYFEIDSYFEVAIYYFQKAEYEYSLKYLNKIGEIEYPEYYMLKAYVFDALNKKEEAINNIKRCIDVDDTFADAYVLMAHLIKDEDANEAVKYLQIALNHDARNADIYMELAAISEASDDFERSIEFTKRYIELTDTDNVTILLKIPVFMHYLGKNSWDKAFFELIRRLRMHHTDNNVRVPIIISTRGFEDVTVYIFSFSDNESYLLRNGEKIIEVINPGYIYGLGTAIIPENKFLNDLLKKPYDNPSRILSMSDFGNSVSPAIVLNVDDLIEYQRLVDEMLSTKRFKLNHIYNEKFLEYMDVCENTIEVYLLYDERKVYGKISIKIIEKVFSFEIYRGKGFDEFCKVMENSAFHEAVLEINYRDYCSMFVFQSSQINIALNEC